MSLLDRRALFFCRTDLLGDPWEGSLTRTEAEQRAAQEERNPGTLVWSPARSRSQVTNSIASCWHMNHYESMAMWRLYLTGREGVAVKSTYKRLIESFPEFDGVDKGHNADRTSKELAVHVGVVHYVDYECPHLPQVPKVLRKRKSFEHEREIRAVATETAWGDSPALDVDHQPKTRFEGGGDYVPTDLGTLIEGIYVSPEAPSWFFKLVRSTVRRFELDSRIHQSDLGRDPVF